MLMKQKMINACLLIDSKDTIDLFPFYHHHHISHLIHCRGSFSKATVKMISICIQDKN